MRKKDYLLLFISVILMVLSFPRFDREFLAWVAFIPWFLAIDEKSPREAGRFSFCLGFVFWITVLFWLRLVTALGLVLLTIYLSLYFSFWGLLTNFIRKKTNFSLVVISPVVWVSLEWLRGVLFTGFPWLPLGNSQYLNIPLIQIAEFSGVYGLSFLIVAVNAVLTEILIRIKKEGFSDLKTYWLYPLAVGFLLLFCLKYGNEILKNETLNKPIKVTVIQGNISQDIKWLNEYENYTREVYQILTEEALINAPDLVVWPETAVTVSLPQDLVWHNTLSVLAEAGGSFLLVGSVFYSEFTDGCFNSTFLISPEGKIISRYDKVHLVPFGEYVPGRKYFPRFFDRIFEEVGSYTPGREEVIFKIPQGRFNVLICFEDIFPYIARQFVRKGSELLVNVSNDIWYGKTSAPFQHMAMGVFRAVENRRYLVRCTNTGISAFVGPQGKILDRLENEKGEPLFVRGFLTQKISFENKLTFYTRFGDLFVYLNLIVSGILLGLSFIMGRRRSQAA